MQILINKIPSVHREDDITTGIKPVEREEANVEVEKGEIVMKPDLSALYKVHGKKHSKGGTPAKLDSGSFVFSDDKTLALDKYDHELLELKKGGTFAAKKNTPAEVLKRNVDIKHYNKMSSTLQNPYKDDIAKNTAALMLAKYQEQIGKIAMAQEDKKNFPEGMPEFADGTAPIYDDDVKEDIMEQQQYMKKGGFLNPYQDGGGIGKEKVIALNNYIRTIPKEGLLPEEWDNRARLAAYLYKNNSLDDGNRKYYEAYINKISSIKTGEQSRNYTKHAFDAFRLGLSDKTPFVKWGMPTQKTNVSQQPALMSSPNGIQTMSNLQEGLHHRPQYPNTVFSQFNRSRFPKSEISEPMILTLPPDTIVKSQAKEPEATPISTSSQSGFGNPAIKTKPYNFTPPQGWRDLQGKTYQQWSAAQSSPQAQPQVQSQPLTVPDIVGNQEQPFGFDTRLNWMDKMNIGNALLNSANINRYMPMRTQVRTSPIRLNRMDPQAIINQSNEAIYNAYQANRVMNPYLAAAQNASMYGRNLGAINQVASQYDQQNAQIANQEAMMNAQMAQQNAMQNAQFDQQYYRESIEGAKNFDNARAFARNRVFDVTGNALEKAIQSQAMNMQLGPESPYFYDYANMRVVANPNRDIMNVKAARTKDFTDMLYKTIMAMPEGEKKTEALLKLAPRFEAIDRMSRSKKGGKFRPRK